jgi:hypothetical protein
VAKITGFRVMSVSNDGGGVSINGQLEYVGGITEDFRIGVNEDDNIGYLQEVVKREMNRRNKLDDLYVSLQGIVGAVVLV